MCKKKTKKNNYVRKVELFIFKQTRNKNKVLKNTKIHPAFHGFTGATVRKKCLMLRYDTLCASVEFGRKKRLKVSGATDCILKSKRQEVR